MGAPYNGTIVGSPTYTTSGVPPAFDEAVVTSSGNALSLSANWPPPLIPTTTGLPFTIDVRVLSTQTKMVMSAVGVYASSSNYCIIGTNAYGDALFTVDSASSGPVAVVGTSLTDGTWHSLRLVYTGSILYAYVDGAVIASAGSAASGYTIGGAATGGIGYEGGGGKAWIGQIDEVAIFSTALTTAASYTVPTTPYPVGMADLVALYHLDGNAIDGALPLVLSLWPRRSPLYRM